MTAHKSKGQEFEHVYIAGVYDGHWGNKRKPELLKLPKRAFSLLEKGGGENGDDDEHRVFYVALTRAKKTITVSYPRKGNDGQDQLPCRFLEEILPEFIETVDAAFWENEFESHKEIIFTPVKYSKADIKDKEFAKELFARNGLSVTALNNYLECPWKYFYTNFLRIPKAPTKHQMYGIGVHAALRDLFANSGERIPDKEFLLSRFEFYLNQQPLSKKDFTESLQKGLKALGGYFDAFRTSWNQRTLAEFSIQGVLLDDIRLTGKIDKMEFSGEGGRVCVVDYKTSRPKTRGEIEGLTKTSDGNIKRQLVFYRLLLDRFERGRYQMVSGRIDFIEPDAKGKYHSESFEVASEEIEKLEETVRQAANEITNLSFWDKRCQDRDCEFCRLRDVMV
jgi:DNA helicase-2/ATP-dependent DNA helicase PcrA